MYNRNFAIADGEILKPLRDAQEWAEREIADATEELDSRLREIERLEERERDLIDECNELRDKVLKLERELGAVAQS